MMEMNLEDTSTEPVSLLKILITTLMTTSDSEMLLRCLKAQAMLSIEKRLVWDIENSNTRVIERLAAQKDR